ncbi:hypothetical protein A0H81_14333 [Grifola frondosa]|uniref:YTH domain-containing protein n=1 Tax=Grifola frondosa TaxID=5627 RepID=A0A1C7LMJ2_GRIFR|nr:hypothetical protein A0H81_14333 [Grifola frondosa]
MAETGRRRPGVWAVAGMTGATWPSYFPSPGAASSANTGGVRRHHTISASSRTRPTSKIAISELDDAQADQLWTDDSEDVDQNWASLPTRYHRAFGGQPSRQLGSQTPRAVNSLSAIAGHDGDEEEWEREMRGLRNEEEHGMTVSDQGHQALDSSSSASPLSLILQVSLTSPLRRLVRPVLRVSVDIKALTIPQPLQAYAVSLKALSAQALSRQSPSPTNAEEEYDDDSVRAEEEYFSLPAQQQGGQYPGSPIGRSSPWNTPGTDWRSQVGGNGGSQFANSGIDDVSLALSALEINQQYSGIQQGQSAHPPRFNPSHPPPMHAPGMRSGSGGSSTSSRKLQLVTDLDGRNTPHSQSSVQSASAYVPPIGHGLPQQSQQQQPQPSQRSGEREEQQQQPTHRDRAFTASGTTTWDQKERLLSGRASNPNLHHIYQGQGQPGKVGGNGNGGGIPNVPPIPSQYLSQGQGPRMGVASPTGSTITQTGHSQNVQAGSQGGSLDGFINSPIDVPTLIATKGYNPVEFDARPAFARYFVIKSYTEDDVHKSLKYEIWSSTDPGNKRLDKAFKETASRGPIYLFFSVNASGHFCGMAEMLTPVDYTRSSTVWASDKWKGVFKVRWIFVRDIPNANLRHIRLNNTQERKPVTNSRDTQELLPDAGQEMLRIFHTHPARTSLLQDFAFYELQAMQKAQAAQVQALSQGTSSPTQTPIELCCRRSTSIDLVLGILPNGASYLLVSEDQYKQVFGFRLPRSQPLLSQQFLSLSPIHFVNTKELSVKLHAYVSNKKTKNAIGLSRAAFEYQRIFIRLCRNELSNENDFALNPAPWMQDTQIFSIAFNTWTADTRPLKDRLQDPRVLDIGWTKFNSPSVWSDMMPVSTTHYIVQENRFLQNRNKERLTLKYGDTKTIPKASIGTLLQDLFAPFHNGQRSRSKILLVYDEKKALKILNSLGVQTSESPYEWASGICTLLYCPDSASGSKQGYYQSGDRNPGYNDGYRMNDYKRRSSRSKSPRRDADRKDYSRPRSPPTQSSHPHVYVVDIRQMYQTLMQTTSPEEMLLSRAKSLGVRDVSPIKGEDGAVIYEEVNDKGWCAGTESRLLAQMWQSMAHGPAIDEQRALRLLSQPQMKAEPQADISAMQAGPSSSGEVKDEEDDEEFDPNDMIQPNAQTVTPTKNTGAMTLMEPGAWDVNRMMTTD